jgi:hypothetical protein
VTTELPGDVDSPGEQRLTHQPLNSIRFEQTCLLRLFGKRARRLQPRRHGTVSSLFGEHVLQAFQDRENRLVF